MLKKFLADESANTAVEYALVTALISIGAYAALEAISFEIGRLFQFVTDEVQKATRHL